MTEPSPVAQCALHPEAPAVLTCTRCGRFACASCRSSAASQLCVACAAAHADPLGLAGKPYELGTVLVSGTRLFFKALPRLALIAAVFTVPAALLQVALVSSGDDFKSVASSVRVSNFYDATLGLVGAVASLALLIAQAEGRTLSVGAALSEGLGAWSRAFVTRLRVGVWILLFLLLLVLPGVWKGVTLMFASTAVVRLRHVDPLARSQALVAGRFWTCLLLALITAVGVFVPVAMLAGGVGLVLGMFEAPRLVEEFLTDWLGRVATDGLLSAWLYVAFVLLHRAAQLTLEPMAWREEPPLATR